MKHLLSLIFVMCLGLSVSAQTLEELTNQKTDLTAQRDAAQATVDDLSAKIGSLDEEIKKLQGWRTGLNGLVGFNFSVNDKWAANPNPDASSSALNLGLTAFANKLTDKWFWRNKGILNKAWQDVDLESEGNGSDLFESGTVDVLNLSSLYGYQLHKYIAASILGEVNTSLGNFLEPGTADIGVGVTWTPPIDDLVVVLHPLNYRYNWLADGQGESTGGLGLKLRADYNRSFKFAGKAIAWSSTFTTYQPYESAADGEASLQEYTWLNSLAFDLFKGIGVGINFGVRQAEFENADLQSFYGLGLSYGFAY